MLDKLKVLVDTANRAEDRESALRVIVTRVKEIMGADACSVYLHSKADERLVLAATDGLNPAAVGRVRMLRGEGLVGLVAEGREPLCVANAWEHPSFRFIPVTGEARYRSFLGIPLIWNRRVLGVLEAQRKAEGAFTDHEVALLVTLAAQLAEVIVHKGEGDDEDVAMAGKSLIYQGLPAAPGVAIGVLVLPSPLANLEAVPDRAVADVDQELTAFDSAVTRVQEELREGSERMADLLPAEAHALFEVYSLLVKDGSLIGGVIRRIRQGMWAPGALRDAVAEFSGRLERAEDPYMKARAEDIRAIGRRLLVHLQSDSREPRSMPEGSVLVGNEVSFARMVSFPPDKLAGLVCRGCSVQSHNVIVARALNIPAVVGLHDLPFDRLGGRRVIVDGYQGRVLVDPPPAVEAEFTRLIRDEQVLDGHLRELVDEPALSRDGERIALYANAGLRSDIPPAFRFGAEGVGLYRTEFPFMLRESLPGEAEQFELYREVLQAFAPRPVVMRTLDIGGDKPLPYLPIEEDNPFLGWRGIRITLDHPEIFLPQLRALLRANAGLGNLRLLLPMVSRVREVLDTRELLDEAYRGLLAEGREAQRAPVGAMVEVPAAVYQIDALARAVDFMSIGTNDLTQYILAVDRNNARVAGLYDGLCPPVLKAIAQAVDGARRHGIPVGICGELAGDPEAALLLAGMGLDSLSMGAPSIPRVKWVIRSFSRERGRELLDEALDLADAGQIRARVRAVLEAEGLGGLVRPGM